MRSRSLIKRFLVLALVLASGACYAQTAAPKPSVMDQPALISAVAPYYPNRVRELHHSGAVKVLLTLDDKGIVTEAKGIGGTPALRPSCERAAKHWKFAPAIKIGEARTVIVTFAFHSVDDDRNATDEDRQHDLITFKPPYEIEIGFWTPVITVREN